MILLAEDDEKQAALVRKYLEHESHQVVVARDGQQALDALRRWRPDLLVLDVMLPVVNGLEVCRIIRQESDLPVLMLTARTEEDDMLAGLDLGADDYMTKPFSPRELTVRVRALLRRARLHGDDRTTQLRIGQLMVDLTTHDLYRDGVRLECTAAEFKLLAAMAARPYGVFTRAQLLEELHGIDRWVSTRTIDTHVLNLRRKIEPDPRRPTCLLTVYGVGYKLTDGQR